RGSRNGNPARPSHHHPPGSRCDLDVVAEICRISLWFSRPASPGLAKARTCAGLTTTTGRQALARPEATTVSKPPVASIATNTRDKVLSQATRSRIPAAVRLKTKPSPVGRTATSKRSFDTSMPTTIPSIRSHPCTNGLRPRPKRLFGFDGTAGEDTHSPAGSATHRFFGLSPATPLSPISNGRDVKLQGSPAHRSH